MSQNFISGLESKLIHYFLTFYHSNENIVFFSIFGLRERETHTHTHTHTHREREREREREKDFLNKF